MFLEYYLILNRKLVTLTNPPVPATWKTGDRDILIIPGLHEQWIGLKKIGNIANTLGFKIHVVTELGNNTASVQSGVSIIKQYISHHDLHDLTLITHSKGGIIGSYLLGDKEIGLKIRKLVTIACPFHGSYLARAFKASYELLPKTRCIENATKGIDTSKVLNLYPAFDNHVVPNKSLTLEGATNIKIDVIGHTRIEESAKTIEEIIHALNYSQ